MKTSFRVLLRVIIPASAGLLISSSMSLGASASREAPPARDRNHQLELEVDKSAIDRNAADRVSYAPIIKATAASVVYVYSSKRVPARDLSPLFNDPMFRRFFPGLRDREGQAPDQTRQGLGSGVIITNDGYIITNNHVVEGADDVKVALGDSRKRYDAAVVGNDPLADIAVLKIEADGLTAAKLGDSEQLEVGDVVLAIGNPFGVGQSVSSGIVSAVGRGNLGIEAVEDFIQTDAAINPGNSGGALIDTRGRVVGINTAIVSGSGAFAGVGFAIPINLVRAVAEQIVNTGRVDRGFLGVALQELTPELAAQFGAEEGALVAEVTPDSPAAKAGLQAGDVITRVNDSAIADGRELLLAVSQLAPETKIEIEYVRDEKTRRATATLALRPNQDVARNAMPEGESDDGVLDGVAVSDITPQWRAQLQIPEEVQGAIVTQIAPDSAAASQGLQEGDILLALDREPIRNAAEAVALSERLPGPKVMVRIWRQGRSLFLVIDESEDARNEE